MMDLEHIKVQANEYRNLYPGAAEGEMSGRAAEGLSADRLRIWRRPNQLWRGSVECRQLHRLSEFRTFHDAVSDKAWTFALWWAAVQLCSRVTCQRNFLSFHSMHLSDSHAAAAHCGIGDRACREGQSAKNLCFNGFESDRPQVCEEVMMVMNWKR